MYNEGYSRPCYQYLAMGAFKLTHMGEGGDSVVCTRYSICMRIRLNGQVQCTNFTYIKRGTYINQPYEQRI
jgi:hypothetical protein